MIPARTPGWQGRLSRYLGACAHRAFEPGQHDCALFAAGAVEAMTGVDPAERWRGRYTTLRGGARVLRRDGYADHIAATAALLRSRAAGERAKPGDLAVVPSDDGPALGVVQGTQVYVLGPSGLHLVPISAADTVFEVP
jgi:hypothetical protein